jgi:hypothetical protein
MRGVKERGGRKASTYRSGHTLAWWWTHHHARMPRLSAHHGSARLAHAHAHPTLLKSHATTRHTTHKQVSGPARVLMVIR